MPEIKHHFSGGKMNKDLDERLVPNGEYTDAMNIQVSTSEDSEVGTVQNILGNKRLYPTTLTSSHPLFNENAVVVSSIADEKNDRLYYFLWTPDTDYILEYSEQSIDPIPVLVDKNKNVLQFRTDVIVTGINIIDDMLFWTDNYHEPKKINISRCKQGTPNFNNHTKLINEDLYGTNTVLNLLEDIQEKHVTVIKKAPRKPLDMVVRSARNPEKIYTGVINVALDPNQTAGLNESSFVEYQGFEPHDFSSFSTEEGNNVFAIIIDTGIDASGLEVGLGPVGNPNGLTGWHSGQPVLPGQGAIPPGTKIVFKPFDSDGTPPGLPVTDFVIKGEVIDAYPADPTKSTYFQGVLVKILSIDGYPPIPVDDQTTLKYVVDLYDETEKLFEFKFPRFSYRYKFEDGEYSPFAPFTQVAFLPGSFDYHPRKGYNLGMTNRAFEIELWRTLTSRIPKDVTEIDILFKDEPSPNIYVVDTIRPNEYSSIGNKNNWFKTLGSWETGEASLPYVIKRETIQSVVPSNQLLRPWDNVPKKALAQEVIGNRIVYANYLQNYDLKTIYNKNYTPNFTPQIISTRTDDEAFYWDDGLYTVSNGVRLSATSKSIKSLREYQLGIVFTDKYGRETPVISNTTGILKIEKELADQSNSIRVLMNDYFGKPKDLTHFKFYVKETSGEYYNMAMDRWYDAEDGNVWLAFPSSDRNKIDIDTFLILKKGTDDDNLVLDKARYKVISIENEAPDFIKTSKILAAAEKHNTVSNDLFATVGTSLPTVGNKEFKMMYGPFSDGPGRNLDKIEGSTLYIEFSNGVQFSDRYKIAAISHDDLQDGTTPSSPSTYSIRLEKTLREDVAFVSNDPTGQSSTSINNGTIVNIYKYTIENKPRFDGRFFVKIYEDENFSFNIGQSIVQGLEYRTVATKKVYFMSNNSDFRSKHVGVTSRFLTEGNTVLSQTIDPSNADAFFLLDADAYNYGYYYIAEFASMATYFRKMRKGNSNIQIGTQGQFGTITSFPDIRNLVPAGASTADVEYPEGEYWKDNSNWANEYGLPGVGNNGYTARWLRATMPGNQGYIETIDLTADSPIDTDVWFIDAGPAVARRSTSDWLGWTYLSPNSLQSQIVAGGSVNTEDFFDATGYQDRVNDPGGHSDQQGLVVHGGKWNMQLSYGGIAGATPDLSGPQNFFNFGGFAGGDDLNNYYYANNKNTGFVQQILPGSRFRWREDPTETIYTLSPDISQKRLLRHSSRYSRFVTSAQNDNEKTGAAVSKAELLSFNFTSGFNLRNIEPSLQWDPTTNGEISGGLIIKLKAANTSGNTSGGGTTATGSALSEDLCIYVSTLIGDNSGGGDDKATIQVGMALSKYTNDLASAVERDVNHSDNLGSTAQEFLVIREIIEQVAGGFKLKLGGYTGPLKKIDHTLQSLKKPLLNSDYTFVQVGMNGYSHNSEFNINTVGRSERNIGAITAVGYILDFIKDIEPENILSENPAIWETEPKETKDLDIYYEASPTIPVEINDSNIHEAYPIGTKFYYSPNETWFMVIDYIFDRLVVVTNGAAPQAYNVLVNYNHKAIRPDGLEFENDFFQVLGFSSNGVNYAEVEVGKELYSKPFRLSWHNCYSFGNGVESNRIRDNFNLPFISNGVKVSTTLESGYKEERRKYGLIYSGLYNSNTGVNNLNQFIQAEKITKDVNPIYGSIQKLHSRDTDLVTLCEDKVLKILANKDAVFNADGNTQLTATENVLGQTVPFAGEYGISKNPESFASESYRAYFSDRTRGAVLRLSMQGLSPISDHGMHDWFKDNLKLSNTIFGSYDDKKDEYNLSLSNKDYRTVKVIGSSKNISGGPYTASNSFLTTSSISNLFEIGDIVISDMLPPATAVINKMDLDGVNFVVELSNFIDETLLGDYIGYGDVNANQVAWDMQIYIKKDDLTTVSFKEDIKGWVSFKSFIPDSALSMANNYYTFKQGQLWLHHDETVDRNTFYNVFTSSSVEVVLNDAPSSVKSFSTLNYEGSQSRIQKFEEVTILSDGFQDEAVYSNQEIYNLTAKKGWHVDKIITDKESGYVKEFIEKEGKWFNNIDKFIELKSDEIGSIIEMDTADFTFQGIGMAGAINTQNLGQSSGGGSVISGGPRDPVGPGTTGGPAPGSDDAGQGVFDPGGVTTTTTTTTTTTGTTTIGLAGAGSGVIDTSTSVPTTTPSLLTAEAAQTEEAISRREYQPLPLSPPPEEEETPTSGFRSSSSGGSSSGRSSY